MMVPATRTSPARLPVLLLLVLPVFVLHYFVIPGLYDPGLHSKYVFLAVYLVLLSLMGIVRRPRERVSLYRIPAWWACLSLPVVMTASLLWARTPMEGLPMVVRWWEVFLLFSLLLSIFSGSAADRERFHRWLPRLGALFVLVTSVAALAQLAWVVKGQGYSHGSTYWVLVSFAHRNLLTHAVALAMPLALLTFLRDRRAWCWLSGLALALGSAALLLLLVRTSWLAMAAAVLVFGAMWWRTRRRLDQEVRRRAGRRLALLVGIGILAMVAGWLAFRPAVLERGILEKHSAGIVGTSYGSPGERSLFWGRTLRLWREKPLTGHGAGSWKIEAPGPEIGGSRNAIGRGEVYVVRAHNDWLQLLAEGGPAALLAFLLLPLLVFIAARRIMKVDKGVQPGRADALHTLCYLQGMSIYLVIAFFSFPMERPSSYVWWGIYPAAILLTGALPSGGPARLRGMVRGSLLALALALAGLGGMSVQLDIRWLQAMDAGAGGNPGRVLELLDGPTLSRQPLAPATTPLAWYRGMAQLELRDTSAAISDFKTALLAHPRHPHVLNNLATLLNRYGDVDLSRHYLETAVAVAPLMEDARLNLAALEFNDGRISAAYLHLRAIPDSSTNAKFPAFRNAIVPAMMDTILARHQGELVYPMLKAMRQNPDWLLGLHEKSKIEHRPFEHQLLRDGIYILYAAKKSISFDQANSLYNHYRLDSIK